MAFLTLLLLIVRRYVAAAVMALLTLGLNSYTEQIPLRLKHDAPQVKPEGTIRVLAYNICGKVEYAAIHATPEFRSYLEGIDADIVFLPENTVGVSPQLEQCMKENYPYSLHDFEAFEKTAGSYADFSIYSRFPLRNYKNYELDRTEVWHKHPDLDSLEVQLMHPTFMAYEVTATIQGRDVTLLHVHLRSNAYDQAKRESDGRRQKVHSILDRLKMGCAFRLEEAKVIRDSLQNCSHPIMVCGDFNDLSGSAPLRIIQNCRAEHPDRRLREPLRDAWWHGGQGFGFTFKDQHLLLRLDHILYSDDFRLQAVRVDDVPYSDHLPLIADFTFY